MAILDTCVSLMSSWCDCSVIHLVASYTSSHGWFYSWNLPVNKCFDTFAITGLPMPGVVRVWEVLFVGHFLHDTSLISLTLIRSVPQTNSSSYISLCFQQRLTQSSVVLSSTWSFIWWFVRLILSPSFESKFEFACHCSCSSLNGLIWLIKCV